MGRTIDPFKISPQLEALEILARGATSRVLRARLLETTEY